MRGAGIVLQGNQVCPIGKGSFEHADVGQAAIGLSMPDAISIDFTNCNQGGYAGIPTQVSAKEGIFAGDKS